MTGHSESVPAKRGWIYDNPYLLLALAALFWSGNHIVGRAIGGEVPPLGISTVRWLLPTIALGIFAFPLIRRDWPVIRAHWGILLWLGLVGGALFTAGQYIGLQYTTALNVSVLNSLVPVLIIATAAIIFRDSITAIQLGGILTSSVGVLVIIARGELSNLQHLLFNWGDIIILFNMLAFAVYAVYLRKRPAMHWLSFIFVFGLVSTLATLPFAFLRAYSAGDYVLAPGAATPLGAAGYVEAVRELAVQIRSGAVPVKRALIHPKSPSATTVTATDTVSATGTLANVM